MEVYDLLSGSTVNMEMSEEEVAEVLRTIPDEALANYGIDLDDRGEEPAEIVDETREMNILADTPTRMKRAGYTITDKADYYNFSHKKWSSRGGKKPIRVVWHHMAGNLTVQQFYAIMTSSRQMSPTVSIHTNGTVFAWVPEEMRPWTTGSYAADQQALTFELANDQIGGNWHLSDKVIDLAAQIHAEWSKRYGIPATYSYRGKGINMHKDWANTACPGAYLEKLIKNGTITKKINAYLNPVVKVKYRVQCGAYKLKKNAVAYAQKLKTAGYQTVLKTEGGYVKIQAGLYSKKANAEKMVKELKSKGFTAAIVEVKV